MKQKIIEILKEFAVNETNEAGVKGFVIWEEDFQEIASRINQLGKIKPRYCSQCGNRLSRNHKFWCVNYKCITRTT